MKIKNFTKVINGRTPYTKNTKFYGGKMTWFKATDFNGKYIFSSNKKLTKMCIETLNMERIPKGTLLLANTKKFGKLAIAGKDCYIGSGVMALMTDESVCLSEYLYYFLEKNSLLISKGVKSSDILDLEIKLPDIESQEKIVKALVDTERLIEINNEHFNLQQNLIFNRFENLYYNIKKSLEIQTIENAGLEVVDYYGRGGGHRIAQRVEEGDYAYVVTVSSLKCDYSDFKMVTKSTYDFFKKVQLKGGEIIISNIGTPGQVFKCPDIDKPMILGPNCIMIKKNKYNDFLFLFFKSSFGKNAMESITGGSAQPKFNKTNFKKISIAFPSNYNLKKFKELYREYASLCSNFNTEEEYLTSIKKSIYIKIL